MNKTHKQEKINDLFNGMLLQILFITDEKDNQKRIDMCRDLWNYMTEMKVQVTGYDGFDDYYFKNEN